MVVGTNLSQIDGDYSAGFKKIGLTGGFKIDYPIAEAWDMSMELLYSKRGSKHRKDTIDIDLNYIEVPLIISIRDWYIEQDKYDKVRADAGLSFGYLFNASTNKNLFQIPPDKFNNYDLSYVLGVGYMFNRHFGIYGRYTRSLKKMYVSNDLEYGGLLSYFITIRGEYHF